MNRIWRERDEKESRGMEVLAAADSEEVQVSTWRAEGKVRPEGKLRPEHPCRLPRRLKMRLKLMPMMDL